MILGIDEVGRGAWAGPMVVGAVVLGDAQIVGLTDSKKLTKKARERLSLEIQQKAAGVGLGWVSARQIDEIGLSAALKLAARRAVAEVKADYDEIIIDGTIKLVDLPEVTLLKKADLLIPAVSAASIVAKVARDAYMARLDGLFAGYKFASHVGYGTAAHEQAIRDLGVLPIHRRSFAPIARYAGSAERAGMTRHAGTVEFGHDRGKDDKSVDSIVENTTKTIGALAEDAAALYLEAEGHKILDRNWKTPQCEIDIVSLYDGTLYFTEVKYRRQDAQGGGLGAITPKKLQKMRFGSDVYVKFHKLQAHERALSVIALSGTPPVVQAYVPSV